MAAGNLFYFLAFVTLFCATMVVVVRNPVYSVLYLILTFFSLTGHYILLNAQFLAAVNIIVYAGAIMVLFLFVIMFLNLNRDTEPAKGSLVKLAAAVAGGMLLVVMVSALKTLRLESQNLASAPDFNSQVGMVENLGIVLFRDFLLPFELASILFLVAMV
jgi:NADH-quinone oxidoreductase subunit J